MTTTLAYNLRPPADPLAYLTAHTNGLYEVAAEILQAAGLSETDIENLPSFSRSSLSPPKVITSTTQRSWPAIPLGESVFEKALVSGALEAPVNPEPFMNGNVNAPGGLGLAEWEGGGALVDEDGGDDGWALDEVTAPDEQTNGHLVDELKGEAASAQPGVNETELWVRNSPYAGDHIAAGSFETAMQVSGCVPQTLPSALIHSSSCSTVNMVLSSSDP